MTDTNEKKESNWKKNCSEAFYGSLLDFMRRVYNDRWLELGYSIVTFVKRPNTEKERVKKVVEQVDMPQTDSLSINSIGKGNSLKVRAGAGDSSAYLL